MLVTFLPNNIKIETTPGMDVETAAVEAGIETGAVCNGRKSCGKCKILVTKGNNRLYTQEEVKHLTEEERVKGFRLACCFTPEEDACVIIEKSVSDRENSFLSTSENSLIKDSIRGNYGIVLDIGTTTLEAILYHMSSGKPVLSKGMLNPQRIYGGDVISRITYAIADDKNAENLKAILKKACNKLINEMAAQYGISVERIEKAVIVGNTTMTGLFLGNSLNKLARAPFKLDNYNGVSLTPKEAGVLIPDTGSVLIMPGIDGHIGGDTLGCVLSTNLYKDNRKILLMDIGTNGEMVLCSEGMLSACSTAAGPAFEGGNISSGMRAENGAITAAEMVEAYLHIHYIGEENPSITPTGICGSGLIDCIYELYKNSCIDETGRFLGQAGEENFYRIWKKGRERRSFDSLSPEEIILTQKDIREFQLATGAIKAGITLLLQEAGIQVEELDKVYLAGNFGSKLSIEKAIGVGLLPDVSINKIEYIGNGALSGAAKLLLQEITMKEAGEISQKVQHIDLSGKEAFEKEFIKAMIFPLNKKTKPSP